MKKTLIVSFLTLLVSVPAVAASSEPERSWYRKGDTSLVVMLARDDCCAYASGLEAAGWVLTTVQNKNAAGFTCYLTIGEVDMALACYQAGKKGRIGTRIIDTDPNGCSVKTLELLAGAGIDNIIQDFRKNGYPDGCTAAGCFGGSGESPSD